MKRFFGRVITAWCLVGLLVPSLVAANDQSAAAPRGPITYAELGEQILSAHGLVLNASQVTDDYGVPVLSKQEKRKMLFAALADYEKREEHQGHEAVHEAVRSIIKDLELFYTQGSTNHARTLFTQLDQTTTVFGEAVLAKMLASPTADIGTLRKRQALVSDLVEDQDLFDEVVRIVQQAQKTESSLLSFWMPEDATKKQVVKGFYFTGAVTKQFNKNPYALEFLTRSNAFWTTWPAISDIFWEALPAYYFFKIVDKNANTGTLVMQATVQAMKNLYNPFETIGIANKVYNDDPSAINTMLKFVGKDVLDDAKKVLAPMFFAKAAGTPLNFLNKYQTIKSVHKQLELSKKTMVQFHAQLKNTASLLECVHSIESLAKQREVVASGLNMYATNRDVLRSRATVQARQFKKLLTLLVTPTFKGDLSFFSYTGRILLAYRLMKEHKDKFVGLMELIGELDACLSIAKLVKKFKDKRVHYSFVEYANQATPYVKMERVWNPMVNPDMVVPNDVELGALGQARNMVLTGSNTGGKSTLLKGMLLSILLAQTLCIAPVDNMTLTPYMYIGSSLNIVDNTADGKSLYQAEVDRAASLMGAAEFFQGLGHSLLIIDELFRGTGPERAEIETYQCAKQLASFDHTNLILATHFKKFVTGLEEETNGVCKNYKIEVKVDDNGVMTHTYKIEEGVSTSNVAATILQHALRKEGVMHES